MLQVPSHLEVTITETLYAVYDQTAGDLHVVPLDHPDLNISANLKYTEKMFLVDPVKVAAGAGGYGLGFGPASTTATPILGADGATSGHGYLHSTNYQADDQTIVQGANLLTNVLNLAQATKSKAGNILDPTSTSSNLTTINRVVAFRRFDLATPCVNEEVFAFLEAHVNACDKCGILPSSNRGVISANPPATFVNPGDAATAAAAKAAAAAPAAPTPAAK